MSLVYYCAVRELGASATALAKRLRLSQPPVSISVKRGEKIAKEKGFEVLEKQFPIILGRPLIFPYVK